MLQTLLIVMLAVSLSPLAAQAQAVFTLTAEQLQNGQAVELDKLGWKYSPNDEPRFAEPQFDDRAWVTLADSAKPEDSSWHGSGWFQLHLRVVPELANQSPEQIIAALTHLGDDWSEGRPQDDDVTFVVLKIKNEVI